MSTSRDDTYKRYRIVADTSSTRYFTNETESKKTTAVKTSSSRQSYTKFPRLWLVHCYSTTSQSNHSKLSPYLNAQLINRQRKNIKSERLIFHDGHKI